MGEYSGVFLVIKHVSVVGFWDWSNSYKGLFFVKKNGKKWGVCKNGFWVEASDLKKCARWPYFRLL